MPKNPEKKPADPIQQIRDAIVALSESQAELAQAFAAYIEKEDTIQMNRGFWIKLARLAALVETLQAEQAMLHNLMRSPEWQTLKTETQDSLRAHAKVIDDIIHID